MSMSILNNISALQAENALNSTQMSLNSTLQQLSTGQRINSGADDAAGLAIANGLQANVSALTQSAQNATEGVGMLQTADGALSQVTTLLNRAVTLATESATDTVSSSQRTALDAEYQSIQAEINQIGSNTTYNGASVFSGTTTNIFLSDGVTNSTVGANTSALSSLGLGLGANASNTLSAIANATATKAVAVGGKTYTFVAALSGAANEVLIGGNTAATLSNLAAAVNGGAGAGVAYGVGTTANANVSASATASTVVFTALVAGVAGNAITSTTTDANQGFSNGGTLAGGAGTSGLTTDASSQAALTAINAAIQTVADTRGQYGAVVNRLQAASNVMGTQQTNLTSAESGIMSADIGQVTANMSKYTILQQTGIAALQQSNQMQQSVLKLLQ